MSTLRVDTLETTDSSFSIDVADLNSLGGIGDQTDPAKGAALVGYKGRSVADVLNDTVNVKNFGAKGDGVTDDTQAFLDAISSLLTGTDMQGGTIFVPHGHYKINQTLQFNSISSVTNFYVRGEGMLNTMLDFGGAPAGSNGIYFNGGSQVGVYDLMVTAAPQHGIVINDQLTSFVSNATIENCRVQYCGQYGIYSNQSYLVSLTDLFVTSNTAGGINFAANHTSIISNRVFTANNGGTGFRINGAVYIDINAQSDNNLRGYLFSNIRGATLRSLGTESNKAEGVAIESSDATAAGILGEYQNIHGFVMIGGCHLRNNVDGPVGANANIAVSALNGRPVEITMIGCVDNVTAGNPSVVLSGAAGQITATEIDCQWEGAVISTPTVYRRNLSNVGRYALRSRSVGTVAIGSGVPTEMVWDTGFSAGENTMNATFSANNITIPAGVSAVDVSAQVTWAGASGGYRYMSILKNGSALTGLPQVRVPAYGTSPMPMMVRSGKPIPVVAGDVFTVQLLHDQGTTINVEGATGSGNWFSVEAIR